jgi:hypothetical protein
MAFPSLSFLIPCFRTPYYFGRIRRFAERFDGHRIAYNRLGLVSGHRILRLVRNQKCSLPRLQTTENWTLPFHSYSCYSSNLRLSCSCYYSNLMFAGQYWLTHVLSNRTPLSSLRSEPLKFYKHIHIYLCFEDISIDPVVESRHFLSSQISWYRGSL